MNNFRMYVPTDIRFGKNRLNELPEVLEPYGKRVLLAYGGGSIKHFGLYDKVVDLLESNGFHIIELAGIEPNPKIDSVRAGVKLIREHALDVILAVGGGSVVDAAKVIAGGVYYDGDAWDLVEDSSKMSKAVPIVDILTLAATGTEMNRNAVISNPERNEKLGTSGWELLPKVSFLDPTNTFTVPATQTAAGAADILSHLFEQYFNHTVGVDVQDNIAEGLMKAVIQHAPTAIQTPDDYVARANILWASTLALNGIPGNGRVGGWTCHPIEHELSAYYDITHGVGLGILTPRWLKKVYADPSTHDKFVKFAKHVWGLNGADDEIAQQAIQATYDWVKSLDVPTTLPGVEITDDVNFDEMAASAVKVGSLEQHGYVPLNQADVRALLVASMTTEGFEN